MELISELAAHFNFDHHFYLLDASADANRYISTTGITPQTLYVFKNVNDDDDDVEDITCKNSFLIVVPASNATFDQNVSLFRRMKKIQRKQINMKIGVFFSSMTDLHTYFAWCRNFRIANIFGAAYPNSEAMQTACPESPINIFKFDPFGKFEVINVTHSETYDGFFLSRKANFQRHALRLEDTDPTHDPLSQHIWTTVLALMNGLDTI